MYPGRLGQVDSVGLDIPRLPARTAVTAQVHGQDAAIRQRILGQLAEALRMAGDAVHTDDRRATAEAPASRTATTSLADGNRCMLDVGRRAAGITGLINPLC
jgi:hypothetical protein